MFETGWFSTLWHKLALKLGLDPEVLPGDWRSGVDADAIERGCARTRAREIKAVCVVHNETSTGVTSDIAEVRRAIDAAGIRRCFWSTRSPRSARSTTATTNGASTSPSPARRRG
jgi:aspartate aminotransferase-like enzyme